MIRAARSGRSDAQLALGRLYLYGSSGLPKSLPTALHWLDRAAQQGCTEACELIGAHIPADLALGSQRPLARWYEIAWDQGVMRAGLVLAQLELAAGAGADPARGAKVCAAVDAALAAGVPDAAVLAARLQARAPGGHAGADAAAGAAAAADPAAARPHAPSRPASATRCEGEREQLWQAGDLAAFLASALPAARAIAQQQGAALPASLDPDQVTLLSRCARALAAGPLEHAAEQEMLRLRDLAAAEHDPHCQIAVGLWHARMHVDGTRVSGSGSANFKKAIRWLTLAGEQGVAEAWYALSRIYIKPEFSQRNIGDAQRYLERAAEMGYRDAQLECGNGAWRARRENENNDVRAVYWLQKAAAQGCQQADAALRKIVARPANGSFAALAGRAPAGIGEHYPLLAARLRLATLFQLSRAEALLLDVCAADQGHCLVVDIRASYGRSKRRLVAVTGVQERRALDAIVQVFAKIDCGPGGPEGNYRQRLYRLKTVLPEALDGEQKEAGEAAPGPSAPALAPISAPVADETLSEPVLATRPARQHAFELAA